MLVRTYGLWNRYRLNLPNLPWWVRFKSFCLIIGLVCVIIICEWDVIMSSVVSACLCVCLFLCICMYVCLSVCTTLTFKSLHLGSSFLVCEYIFGISSSSVQVCTSRSSGQGQGHTEQKSVSLYPVCGWSAFDWKAFLLLKALLMGIP